MNVKLINKSRTMWNILRNTLAMPALFAHELINGRFSSFEEKEVIFSSFEEEVIDPPQELPFFQSLLNENSHLVGMAGVGITLIALSMLVWRSMKKTTTSSVTTSITSTPIDLLSKENPSSSLILQSEATAQKMPVQLLYAAFIEKTHNVDTEILPGVHAYAPLAGAYHEKQAEVLRHLGLPENGNIPQNKAHYRQICEKLNVPCSI